MHELLENGTYENILKRTFEIFIEAEVGLSFKLPTMFVVTAVVQEFATV